MKVLVCQHGARHKFQIPKFFYEEDLLAGLYTDSNRYSMAGKLAKNLSPLFKGKVLCLYNRNPHPIPEKLIYSTDSPLISDIFHKDRFPISKFIRHHKIVSRLAMSHPLKEYDLVYNMHYENLDFLEFAKKNGKKIIIDVFINPVYREILGNNKTLNKYYKFSKYELEITKKMFKKAYELADVVFCPSNFVVDGIQQLIGETSKCRKVAYGNSLLSSDLQIIPKKKFNQKILFIGNDFPRKGIVEINSAAKIIKEKHPDIIFTIVGNDNFGFSKDPNYQLLNFVGQKTKNEVINFFQSHSIFLMPSYAEGQAGVLIEALSFGLPIITTRESGVDFQNDNVGEYVQAGNYEMIVEKVLSYIQDDKKLENQSLSAIQFVKQFSLENWKKRILQNLPY